MTLAQLSYIVAVDTHRHFVKAAEHCGITQPTLSMQIQKLESELGVRIFDRTKQPVEPTDLGRRLIDQARLILSESERLGEIVNEATGTVSGELRLGVIPTLAPYTLPHFIVEFGRRYPAASLVVEEVQTEQLVGLLQAGRLDAGLVATGIESRWITETILFEEPFVGYLSEGHPLFAEAELNVDDLSLDDLWLLNEGHCFRDQVVQLCGEVGRPGRTPRPLRFESGSLETLKRLVESSGGLTLLPYLATIDLGQSERERVRPFAAPAPSRQVRLIQGKTYLKRGLIEAFVGELMGAVGRILDTR
jgi:LysR family hydrogen peroxide-inducible transcriptional activator